MKYQYFYLSSLKILTMKKIFTALFVGLSLFVSAQTTLYTNNFDNVSSFTLQAGSSNAWVINNVYAGGTLFTGTVIPNVPQQPASFSNPNQNYLHPTSPLALTATLTNVSNANFLLGGTTSLRAVMSAPVDASNYQDVTVSFWRTGGLNGMKLIYSVDGGSTWLDAGLSFQGSPTTWVEETILVSALDGQADIRVGFEMNEATLSDPAPNHYHSIDELKITAVPSGGGAVGEISSLIKNPGILFCEGEEISIDYEVSNATLNAGNLFTLEMSDAAGDFTSPTVIGTLASSQAIGSISGNLPFGSLGSGFRVRVNSSDVAIVGDDNGLDFTILEVPAIPIITLNANGDLEVATNAPDFEWLLNGSSIANSQNQTTITPIVNGSYTVVAINVRCQSVSDPFVIDFVNTMEQNISSVSVYPNPVNHQLNLVYDKSLVSEIYVTDVTGKVVFKTSEKINLIDFSAQNKGLYFVHLVGKDIEIFKIVKQ